MITSDRPDRLYSTRTRTAVVLTGSGTAGAYHAGVLRALHEAGLRIDMVAGRGIGAATAMYAAVDGGARLWEAGGVWKGSAAKRFYTWRTPLRVAGWSLAAAAAFLLFPLLLFALAIAVGLVAFVLTLMGFDATASALTGGFAARLAGWFAPGALPTTIPRLILLCVLAAAAALTWGVVSEHLARGGRRTPQLGFLSLLWRMIASPMSSRQVVDTFAADLWTLIKGAAPVQRPRHVELARRYVELLAENSGQPGFRELLLVVHDMDARQDVVFAFVAEQYRRSFFTGGGPGSARHSEAFDLAGVARDQAMDVLSAALVVPLAAEPHVVPFPPEGPWRGESHRMCDRPGALVRVLEEVAAAGVEQVIVVSASPRAGRPHELTASRGDLRGAVSEQLAGFEAAVVRDAVEQFTGRFAGLYVIRPDHNPLGPLEFSGVWDERSDRAFTLAELADRGYEDAYHQFIDPVVGASGEKVADRLLS